MMEADMNDATTVTRKGKRALPVTQPEVWFLLDRSGSMQSIASDVVGGFNQFFAEQRAQAGQLRVTVVQFDNEAPHEVLIDRADVANVVGLDAHRYKPRGMTPLFDAIDLLLDRAERAGGSPTITGRRVHRRSQNASPAPSRGIFAHIARLKDAGWTFVSSAPTRQLRRLGGLGVAPGACPLPGRPPKASSRFRQHQRARANGAGSPSRDATPNATSFGADARKRRKPRRRSETSLIRGKAPYPGRGRRVKTRPEIIPILVNETGLRTIIPRAPAPHPHV